jgi:hypothetical protein
MTVQSDRHKQHMTVDSEDHYTTVQTAQRYQAITSLPNNIAYKYKLISYAIS